MNFRNSDRIQILYSYSLSHKVGEERKEGFLVKITVLSLNF